MRKRAVITPLGMNRDLAMSKFDVRFAFENMNLRLTTDKSTSKFVMTNERGPKPLDIFFPIFSTIEGHEGEIIDWVSKEAIPGDVIGTSVIDRHLVLFTHGEFSDVAGSIDDVVIRDYIIRLDFNEGTDRLQGGRLIEGHILYEGNLGFDLQHPIETLPFYETEDIKKVYWTDGKNQPRMINIMADNSEYDDSSFNYALEINGHETISITRLDNTNRVFPSGTVQYAFTYYRKYGSESSIVNVSELHFIADDNRGSAPDENVACSFKITIGNLDTRYDGVRLYRIIRTSDNGMPAVMRVIDMSISYNSGDQYGSASFIDSNNLGEDVEATHLLYVGAKNIVVQTITQKDNTAFYGNIEQKNVHVSDSLRNAIHEKYCFGASLGYVNSKTIDLGPVRGKYNYESQLSRKASDIRFFQYGETYRFGLQFQDKYGAWSDAVWIDDYEQNVQSYDQIKNFLEGGEDPFNGEEDVVDINSKTVATFKGTLTTNGLDGIDDYVAVRPVVVYPDNNDRTILAQGILTPSVYNLDDRINNGTYAQMSWFSRPIFNSSLDTIPDNIEEPNQITNIRKLEYRHYKPIPPVNKHISSNKTGSNAEILCNVRGFNTNDYTYKHNLLPVEEYDNSDKYIRAKHLCNIFFIDQSVNTFHSPELEYGDLFANMDMDNVSMRIVGIVPLTYNDEGVLIEADKAAADNYFHLPDRQFVISGNSNTKNAYQQFTEFGGVQADFDNEIINEDDNDESQLTYYGTNKIYPFHTKTLTHNADRKCTTAERIKAFGMNGNYIGTPKTTLLRKIYDTIKYSYDTVYFNEKTDIDIDIPSYFNTVDYGISRLYIDEKQKNFNFNVDKTIVPSFAVRENQESAHYVNKFIYPGIGELSGDTVLSGDINTNSGIQSNETISMKYNSTSALAIHLKSNGKSVQMLPSLGEFNKLRITNTASSGYDYIIKTQAPYNERFIWDEYYNYICQEDISLQGDEPNIPTALADYGFFYLAELYRNNVTGRFGGNTPEAIANNVWLPCGPSVSLHDDDGTLKSSITIDWLEGDTYYQRYDNLHTYPSTEDDINQIVDIVSFMCETHINIDGRYDRNRGLEDNSNIRPTNSNQINGAYNQRRNYFQYRAVDTNKLDPSYYPATVAWTKTKQNGEYTDTFTNITLANTIDMDGAKGAVRSLRRLFDEIIAFQDTGISRILYNEQQAVQTDSGVPLEIANSGKVTGKHYISETIGCHNKWSIVSSPSGLYFADDTHKDIMRIGGDMTIKSVAVENGFRSWADKMLSFSKIWNVTYWDNIKSVYDKKNGEVMFVNKENSLSFNEQFGQFTSFYDYDKVPFLESVNGHNVIMKKNGLYDAEPDDDFDISPSTLLREHNKGDYNDFFGVYKPFYTELIYHSDGTDNDSPLFDKTWTNVSFQLDTFDSDNEYLKDERFDRCDCETEYQRGFTEWTRKAYPHIGKKFRMWHADLPRDGYDHDVQGTTTDRLRNPWLRLRLTKHSQFSNYAKKYRSVLHSIIIEYLEQ